MVLSETEDGYIIHLFVIKYYVHAYREQAWTPEEASNIIFAMLCDGYEDTHERDTAGA